MTTLFFSLVVLATLRLERSTSSSAWLGYGALWGIAVLTNPAVLSTLPFLGAWVWLRHWRRGENCTAVAAAASLVFLCATGPWIWRCSRVYGRFVAFRGSIGQEFLVGNSDDTRHASNFQVIPGNNPAEMEKVKTLGEPAYMAEKQREAWEVISRRPLSLRGPHSPARPVHLDQPVGFSSALDPGRGGPAERFRLQSRLGARLCGPLSGGSGPPGRRRSSADSPGLPPARLLPDPFRDALPPSDRPARRRLHRLGSDALARTETGSLTPASSQAAGLVGNTLSSSSNHLGLEGTRVPRRA